MTPRWTAAVRREVLSNGLTLLAQRDPTAPAVAVVSHVRAGFFDEPDAQVGVSHVLEHMLFKGTPTRGVGAIARETKAAGGYLNASTSYDHTSYYTVLPAASLPVALDLQSDALRRSLIDPEELRRELRVIIEEAKRKLDQPGAVTAETLHALLFDHHRIRRWRIGTESHLAAMTHQDIVGYYRSRYLPGRTIVAMAGDLDPEAAIGMARDLFAGWPAAEPGHDPSPQEPPRREVRTRTLRGDLHHGHLVVGWRAVPSLHPDAAALDVAAAVLGLGRAGWLYRQLRAPGIVTSIGAWHFSPTEVGVFSVGAELDPGRLDAALAGIAGCVARLRDTGPDPADMARVRTQLVARWARGMESTEGRASALASAEAQGGIELLELEYDRLMSVDADAVRRVAKEWLDPEAIAGCAYLPDDAPDRLEPGNLRARFLAPAPAIAGLRTPPAPVTPAPVASRGITTAGVLHIALPGADLLIGRKLGVPLISLGVYRRRSVAEVRSTAGLGALAVRTAVRGTATLDAAELALAFEACGGTLAPMIAADWFGFATTVLSEHAVTAAGLLEEVLVRPRLDGVEIGLERATLSEEAIHAADDMVRYPIQLALAAGFGPEGYGLPAHGLPETVPQLSGGMVQAWHACEMATGRTTIVAVGELDPERLADQLAGIFGGGAERSPIAQLPRAAWQGGAPGHLEAVVERTRKQSALAVMYPGPGRRAPERHAAEVWAAIASGLGGRLFTALRDRRSLAYTVMASSWQRAGAGALLLYLATSPAREAEARRALLVELERFREEPPEPEELARAVSYLAGQAQVGRQTASAVAGEIAEAWLLGEGLAEVEDPAAGYRSVTAAQVLALAASALAPSLRVEGIVRGREELRAEYVSGVQGREPV
ncbi:MAG TPA: insulinase family protein [Gemmatimonadales bacterium]|nr:insulinase family protein [Gemmatimonadales bacterium]